MTNDLNRRDFLKLGGAAAVAGAVLRADASAVEQAAYGLDFAAPPMATVRIGYVGVGGQGMSHVTNLLRIQGCRITAVCDIRSERTDIATAAITKAGQPA